MEELSIEYHAAIAAHNEAQRIYTLAQIEYRAQRSDDATFLAARAVYTEAGVAFDAAYAKEAAKHE